jgi:hypothetical protein
MKQSGGYLINGPTIVKMIGEHIPSLSDDDEALVYERITRMAGIDESVDAADLALRTCMCGERIDGFYAYVDHLNAVFGNETHYGG